MSTDTYSDTDLTSKPDASIEESDIIEIQQAQEASNPGDDLPDGGDTGAEPEVTHMLSAGIAEKLSPLVRKTRRRRQERSAKNPEAQGVERLPDYPGMLTQHTRDNPEFTVLIVDDCRPTRLLVRSILNACGVREIKDAADGAEALETIDKSVPDLIISDVAMTPLDGIELSRLIRMNPRSPDPDLPIVIMTGFTEKSRIVELRQAGLTEVVAKPLSPNLLCRNVLVALRSREEGALPEATEQPTS